MVVLQTMKFLLPIAVIVLTNIGQMVRSQMATPEDDSRNCLVGVHCLLGPEVLDRVLKDCASLADDELVLDFEKWIEMEGFKGLVGLPLEELIAKACGYSDEEIDKILDAIGEKFVKKYSGICKNPLDPTCTRYNKMTECYFEIYGEEKTKNNCGYPEKKPL